MERIRILCRIYRLGEKSSPEWPKATSFLGGGVQGHVPPEMF